MDLADLWISFFGPLVRDGPPGNTWVAVHVGVVSVPFPARSRPYGGPEQPRRGREFITGCAGPATGGNRRQANAE